MECLGNCKICNNARCVFDAERDEYDRKYREKNKEKVRAGQRKYYEKNREKILEYQKNLRGLKKEINK